MHRYVERTIDACVLVFCAGAWAFVTLVWLGILTTLARHLGTSEHPWGMATAISAVAAIGGACSVWTAILARRAWRAVLRYHALEKERKARQPANTELKHGESQDA